MTHHKSLPNLHQTLLINMLGLLRTFNNLSTSHLVRLVFNHCLFHYTWMCHNQCFQMLHCSKFYTHTTCFLNKQILSLVLHKMYLQLLRQHLCQQILSLVLHKMYLQLLRQHLCQHIPHPFSNIIGLQCRHKCRKMSTKHNKMKTLMTII